MKNIKAILLVAAMMLLPCFANIVKAESLEEIKKYFELRDTIGVVNLEMKRALKTNSRSPLLTKKDGTENLKRLILFLEHRIQQFSKVETPLKYHYVRKLGEDFTKSRELYTAVVTKIRGNKIPNTALNSPVSLENSYKLEYRPFFKPIDVRTILSPALAKSLKYTDKELERIDKDEEKNKGKDEKNISDKDEHQAKVKNENKVEEMSESASGSKTLETNLQQVDLTSDKANSDKVDSDNVESKVAIDNLLVNDQKSVVINASDSKEMPASSVPLTLPVSPASSSTILVVPPPSIEGDIEKVAMPTSKIVTIASATAIIEPGKGKDVRIVKKSSMRPLAIMVENHNKARPQTGLEEAEIVYEIPVEGGITRFMPIYFHIPGIVGPVRSCREYFVDRALEVKALYIHCGGSPKGYAYLSKSKINSIDEIRHSKPYYRYKGRRAPHNLYTTGKKIMSYMKGKVEMKLPEQRLPLRYGKSSIAGEKSVKVLKIRYHGNYKVKYSYNSKEKFYERFMNRVRHIDHDSKKPIRVGTIILQTANMKTVDKVGRQEISFIGKGPIKVLQAGKIISGTWSKKTPNSFTDFLDANGKSIVFPNKYPVWVQVVSPNHKVLLDPKPEPKKAKTTKKKKKSSKKSSSDKKIIETKKKQTDVKVDKKKDLKQTALQLEEKKEQKQAASKTDKQEGRK